MKVVKFLSNFQRKLQIQIDFIDVTKCHSSNDLLKNRNIGV